MDPSGSDDGGMEDGAGSGGVGLSTAAVVAIVCNMLVAVLIFVLFLVLYRACKVPSSQEREPVLTPTLHQREQDSDRERSEHKYLLSAT